MSTLDGTKKMICVELYIYAMLILSMLDLMYSILNVLSVTV